MGNGCDIPKQNANCGSNIRKPAVINDEGSTSETTADGNVNPSTFDVERGDVESSAGSPSEKTKSASRNSKSEAAEASDDECSSIVSSNTVIYEDANCEGIEISEEETQDVVFERGVNDLPASVNVRLQVPSQSKLNKNSKIQEKTNQEHLLSLNNCTASVDPGAALVRIGFDDLLASKDAQLHVLSQTKLNRNTAICWKSILTNAPTSRFTVNSFSKLPFCAALVTDRDFSSTADMDEPCVCVFCGKAVFVPDAQQEGQKQGFSSMFCYLCLDKLTQPEQRRFSCNICDMSFKAISHLLSHSKVHKREGLRISVMCYICKKVLTRAYAVKQHMISHSGETYSFPEEKKVSSPDISQCSAMTTQTLLSSDCSRVAKGASWSLANQGNNDRGEPVKSLKLPPGSALVSDRGIYRIKNEENPFACGFCSKTFRKKNYVRAHIIQRHEEKRYSCEICGKRFAKQGDLSTHVTIHTQEKPFACDQCGMRFRLKQNLRRHKFSHSEERSYSCNKCYKSFKTSCVLATHKQSHNKDDRGGKGIICSICKRVFSNRNKLKQHMMTHTGEKRFKCTLCDKQYRQKIGLHNHMNTHSGKKWHKNELCSLCGKTVTAYYMPVHMRMHSGENPFECSICFKRFPKKQNLEGHMRSHTGEKPFACSGCDKRFALYSNMVTHKRKCVTISENRA